MQVLHINGGEWEGAHRNVDREPMSADSQLLFTIISIVPSDGRYLLGFVCLNAVPLFAEHALDGIIWIGCFAATVASQ